MPPAKAPEPMKPEPPKVVADATKAASPKSDISKLTPKPEASFFDDLFGGTPAWVIGGGALAALGGIAALVAARRRKTVKFEDSIIGGTDIQTNTVFVSDQGVVNRREFNRHRFQPRGSRQHRYRHRRRRWRRSRGQRGMARLRRHEGRTAPAGQAAPAIAKEMEDEADSTSASRNVSGSL